MGRKQKGVGEMADKITRDTLASLLSKELSLSHVRARELVDRIISNMSDGIVHEGKLMLQNFGLFKVLSKKERIGRNPRTGKDATILARKSISFYSARSVKLKS
jgi:integration host factor subunit alpha